MADEPKAPIRWLRSSRAAAMVKQLTKVAIRSGGAIDQAGTPQIAHWRVAGRCSRPINREINGYGHFYGTEVKTRDGKPMIPQVFHTNRARGAAEWEHARTIQMEVPCRRCPECMKARAELWADRAAREWERAYYLDPKGRPRGTWLCTLTFHPDNVFAARCRARARLDAKGVNMDAWPVEDRLREMHREMWPLVDRYLKDLRKGRRKAGHAVIAYRYLLTVEPHPERPDVPHYHALIHESSPLQPITYRRLKAFWPHGHSHFKTVDTVRGAYYAAKYLGKYNISRVPASRNYGNEVDAESATQILNKLLLEQQHRISQLSPNEKTLDPSSTKGTEPTPSGAGGELYEGLNNELANE